MSNHKQAMAHVMLGIVAIISIVSLLLLFQKASLSGSHAKGSLYADYWVGKGPGAKYSVAPRRVGELPQPVEWEEEVKKQAQAASEAQQPPQLPSWRLSGQKK
ncbi:hypothetical protein HYV79_01410 [Candidatus Woesearchaeota archaeon]|nr:hypothetical protein [Candidatus Woesearchaeota archaeon]